MICPEHIQFRSFAFDIKSLHTPVSMPETPNCPLSPVQVWTVCVLRFGSKPVQHSPLLFFLPKIGWDKLQLPTTATVMSAGSPDGWMDGFSASFFFRAWIMNTLRLISHGGNHLPYRQWHPCVKNGTVGNVPAQTFHCAARPYWIHGETHRISAHDLRIVDDGH